MIADSFEPAIIPVSQEGQVTIPYRFREKCGIDTPDAALIYEEKDRIVIEPLPTLEDLHGIHAGNHEPGEILSKAHEQKRENKRCEKEQTERLNS